jgi:hypothetical protein
MPNPVADPIIVNLKAEEVTPHATVLRLVISHAS